MLPATLETTQWGWFDNAQAAGAARQFRRHHRAGNDDAQPQSGRAGHDHRADQETAHRFPGRGPHTLTGPIYIEEAQPGDVLKVTTQQDRSARLRDELQRAGHVRPVPERLSRMARSSICISTSTSMTTEFLPGVVLPLQAFPGHARRRAQGSRPLLERAAG